MVVTEPVVLMPGNDVDIGITARLNENGYVAVDIGMGADPEKFTPDFVRNLRASMEPWEFEKEMLRNWDAQTGQAVFRGEWLARQKARAQEPLFELDTEPVFDGAGEVVRDAAGRVTRKLVRKAGGRIRVYIEPKASTETAWRSCAIGADVGAGVGGSDSAAVVMFADKCEQAAAFNCNVIEPAEFGRLLVLLARYYNDAVVCPAARMHGITVIRAMVDAGYGGRIWRHCEGTKLVEVPGDKLGWRRGESSDERMFGYYVDAMQNDTVMLHGLTTIEQHSQYVYDERGRVTMQSLAHLPVEVRARHGDLVIAAALCCRACKDMPLYERVEVEPVARNTYAWRRRRHVAADNTKKDNIWQ